MKLFLTRRISPIVTMLDQMNTNELEALAVKLYTQMDGSPIHSELPTVELEQVKSWIATHRKETESYSELSFFLNLL